MQSVVADPNVTQFRVGGARFDECMTGTVWLPTVNNTVGRVRVGEPTDMQLQGICSQVGVD